MVENDCSSSVSYFDCRDSPLSYRALMFLLFTSLFTDRSRMQILSTSQVLIKFISNSSWSVLLTWGVPQGGYVLGTSTRLYQIFFKK